MPIKMLIRSNVFDGKILNKKIDESKSENFSLLVHTSLSTLELLSKEKSTFFETHPVFRVQVYVFTGFAM
jgi:hypothetical protein